MTILTAIAAEIQQISGEAEKEPFDEYCGSNHPGQHWACYRGKKEKEKEHEKNLHERLTELLLPSTTQQQFNNIPKNSRRCAFAFEAEENGGRLLARG